MKKISLILALVLVLACCVFAACSEESETSSEAASSEAATSENVSKEESVAASEAESEAVSEAESEAASEAASEAVSEDESVAESVPEDTEPVEGENIAKGKSVTISGNGIGHGPYTADLTDGNAVGAMAYDGTWFAFYCNTDAAEVNAPDKVGYAIIDLGKEQDIAGVRANLVNNTGAAVLPPKAINVYLSNDGESWEKVGTLPTSTAEDTAYWAEANVDGSARYVKVEFELDGIFAFVNEIEVIA